MSLYLGKKRVIAPTGRRKRTFSQFLDDVAFIFGGQSDGVSRNTLTSYVGVLDYTDGKRRPVNPFGKFAGLLSLKEIPLIDLSQSTSWWYAFYNCKSLVTIPAFDTSKVTDFGSAFYNCFSLTSLPQLDTSKVTNFTYAFQNCSSLTSLPQLDTSNVTNFYYAFQNCSSLTKIEKLDISQNKSFHYCFAECRKLAYANFVGTAPIRELGGAFQNCYILPNDCFPTLDVTNLTELWWAYANCCLLEELKWTGTPPTIKGNVNSAFLGCSKLKEIPEMDLSSTTLSDDYSFAYNCSSLTAIHAKNIPFSLNISWSTKLEREALAEIIGNLKDMTGSTAKTLTLGSTLKAKLTADDIKVATDKNWTVA